MIDGISQIMVTWKAHSKNSVIKPEYYPEQGEPEQSE